MLLRFKLNYLYQGQNAPFLYGVDAGLYARQGIEIAFVEGFSSSLVTKAIVAGEADCGFGDLSSLFAHAAIGGKPPIRAIMPIYQRSPCALGYLREGAPIQLADIGGRALCGPRGDTSARLLPRLLRLNGLDHLSYEMLYVQPEERDALVASGGVLAATCFDATLKFAMTMRGHDSTGLHFLYFADHGLDIYTGSLVCRADILDQHGGLAEGLREATVEAWHRCYQDPGLGVAAVMARAPRLDPALVRQQLCWILERQIFPHGPTVMRFDRLGPQMHLTAQCADPYLDAAAHAERQAVIDAICLE